MSKATLLVLAVSVFPGMAHAATTAHVITGTIAEVEQGCNQIAFVFSSNDCTYGRNRPGPNGEWIGPLSQFGAAHYAPGSPGAVLGYVPTTSTESPEGSGTFIPAPPDGKIKAAVTGTLSINDNGTPGDAGDDKIGTTFSIGPMVRNIQTGQFTRAVQGWTRMDHQMAEISVSSAVANANGGIDYVIGSRGFPARICNAANAADCFPTANSSNSFSNSRFWAAIPPLQVGIERSGLLGDPGLTDPPTQPPPLIPTGNVGATSTATFTGLTCSSNNVSFDDCVTGPLVWGAGEPAGFDNIVMKVSTDSQGAITSAQAYYSEEYRIGAFGAPEGYDNSATTGTFSFKAAAAGPANLVIAGCDTGVPDYVFPNGSTFSTKVQMCATSARNHGKFVSCVAGLTNAWKKARIISGAQKGSIMRCAAKAP